MRFAFWRQENAESTGSFALFGKLPRRADFLRVNATVPVATEYDQLLADAVAQLSNDIGWQSAYDVTGSSLFAYRSQDKQCWFIGGQSPSRDEQGRRFPLVGGIARSARGIGDSISLLPLAYEVFYSAILQHLDNAIAHSLDAVTCRGFLEGFSGTSLKTGADFELPRELLNQFAVEQGVDDLQSILHFAYPRASLAQAMINIAFYANFIRHYPLSGMAQEIVLPLPAEVGAIAMSASVWLTLIGELAGDARRIAGFFFRDDFIVIVVDRFSRHFSPLLPLTHSVKVRGLMLSEEHATWQAHACYTEISYAITRLVAEPDISMQSVFDCAGQVGRRLLASE